MGAIPRSTSAKETEAKVRYILAIVVGAIVCALMACSGGYGAGSRSPGNSSVGVTITVPEATAKGQRSKSPAEVMDLVLPTTAIVSTINYTLDSASTGNSYAGSIDVSADNTNVASWLITGVNAAPDYLLTVTGQTSYGEPEDCNGTSALFAVNAGQVTDIGLNVLCVPAVDSGTGAVDVDASFDECPVWTYQNYMPSSSIPAGTSTTLTIDSVQSGAPNWTWTVSSGTGTLGSDTPQVNSNDWDDSIPFTCNASGETDTIQVVIGITNVDTSMCPATDTTATFTVTCQ